MAFLTANNGPQAGKRYELAQAECVMGRHPECDIIIDVGAVSRTHCKITVDGQRFLIEDLDSRNKTFLNERELKPFTPVALMQSDQIRICDVAFTFFEVAESSLSDSSRRAVMVDDDSSDSGSSTIMSKLDVQSSLSGAQLSASAEAKLHAMIQITQSLGKALSLDRVLPQVLESLFRIFVQADRGFIGLLDEKQVLIPRYTHLRRDSDETIRVSRTIAKQVMNSKEAVLSADAATDSRFEMSQSVADYRIRSMMCAPLLDSESNAFGVLQIDTVDQRQRFRDNDLEMLVAAATQASIAIENARLHEQALQQRVLARDLELAKQVQQRFLPNGHPDFAGYDFYSYYRAANHIGGDYYDYIRLPQGRLGVVVADVVGHGVAAAMLMAKLSAEVRFCLASEADPSVAITNLNQHLCQLDLDRFVTLVMVVLDPQTHDATIVIAGHDPPVYRRADGVLEEPGKATSGVPLGILNDVKYGQTKITLAPGESLTLHTDGLKEAINPENKQYTMERLRQEIRNSDGLPESIGLAIVDGVQAHRAGRAQDDDMCLVVVRRKKP